MYDIIGPGLNALMEYLSAHVLTCLIPAFFISGAIAVLVTKGTIIGFDELNCHYFPGETLALRETLGLDRFSIRRSPLNPLPSYIVIE